MKRFLNLKPSEMINLSNGELLESVFASESRIIMAESIVTKTPSDGITGAEVARAFGADLILLNLIDVFEPKIAGLPMSDNPIELITELTGRPVGLNLEPIDLNHDMMVFFLKYFDNYFQIIFCLSFPRHKINHLKYFLILVNDRPSVT